MDFERVPVCRASRQSSLLSQRKIDEGERKRGSVRLVHLTLAAHKPQEEGEKQYGETDGYFVTNMAR